MDVYVILLVHTETQPQLPLNRKDYRFQRYHLEKKMSEYIFADSIHCFGIPLKHFGEVKFRAWLCSDNLV